MPGGGAPGRVYADDGCLSLFAPSVALGRSRVRRQRNRRNIVLTAIPVQYIHNSAFYWKIAMVLIAGRNTVYFTLFGEPWALGEGEDAPLTAKFAARLGHGSVQKYWRGLCLRAGSRHYRRPPDGLRKNRRLHIRAISVIYSLAADM
jgi:hypothetical protein